MKRVIVPVATMLAVQVMVSLSVLSLSVMMPAVARDLAIDPKLVGVFTAITYAVAASVALASAAPILRLGAVRVCQGALLMAAAGLALSASASIVATVVAVAFIGVAQGPINPASTHILTQRVPRDWYSFVFSVKQTGVPLGFAVAGIVMPLLLGEVGWQGAALAAGAAMTLAAIALEPLRPGLDVKVPLSGPSPGVWRSVRFVMAHGQLRVLGWSALVYVIAQHTFTFYLVTYLYQHCGLSIARAGFLLFVSQMVGTGVRLVLGGLGDRVPRILLLAGVGVAMALGAIATGLLAADSPPWLIAGVVVAYGAVAISWNGVSMAEFAHLSPPGQAAAVSAVQTALAFSGAVIGPPIFGLIAVVADYRTAFFIVATCVMVAAAWQVVAARRPLPAG